MTEKHEEIRELQTRLGDEHERSLEIFQEVETLRTERARIDVTLQVLSDQRGMSPRFPF